MEESSFCSGSYNGYNATSSSSEGNVIPAGQPQ